MFPQIEIKHNIGNTIRIPNQLDVLIKTYTSSNAAIGATSVSVDNGNEFVGSNILLLLGSLAAGNAEIVTSSAHTGSAFTTSALIQNHARGELVQEISWDKIQIYKSSTIDGSYSQLGSDVPFQVTQMNTIVFDTAGLSSDYYKVRWKNSQSGLTSSFSDPISVLAYSQDSAGALFKSITTLMGIQENDTKITTPWLLESLDDARKVVWTKLYGVRQPQEEVFNFPIKVLAGSNFVPLPDDIDFTETDRSLLSARFIINNILVPYNMRYVPKRDWNQVSFYSTGGITTAEALTGATSITVNSVGDFAPQGGQANVATTDYDQTIIQISYTSIDYTTNELLGVTGLTRDIPVDTQIWVTASFSQPTAYTVYDGKIWFTSVVPGSMQGNNLYVDYYKRQVRIENLYDIIPEKYREIYKPYIRWAIKYRKDVTTPTSDPDLVKFQELLQAMYDNLYSGQSTIIITS